MNSAEELVDLVHLARGGDENAMDCLLVIMTPVARMYASVYAGRNKLEKDDLMQEGLIGLLDAVRIFDASKASFVTLAGKCMKNRIVSAVRSHNNQKNQPLNSSVSLDFEPQGVIALHEETFDLIADILKTMTPAEKEVFGLYWKGYSISQIAQSTAKSKKSVDNALQRAKKKVISYIEQ